MAAAGAAGCGGGGSADRTGEPKLGDAATTVPARTEAVRRPPPPKAAPARREPSAAQPQPPAIKRWPIPFPAARMRDTAAYAQRHYGVATTRLRPRVIVEHYTAIPTAGAVHALFSRNAPDRELRELPGLCSHYLIDRDGTIFELVPVPTLCRHTVGLNHVAIGIEHVGASDREVMQNGRQREASLRLTAWLRCRHGIGVEDVIGHAESLSSPHHRERVARLRGQTHPDFAAATMRRYRAALEAAPCGAPTQR